MTLQPSTGDESDGVRRRQFLRAAAMGGGVSLAPLPVAGRFQTGSGGEELWRFEVGDWVTASPTVVGGTVYVGSFDASVYALDAETGRQRWRYGTNSPITSAPAVVDAADGDGKRVFVGTQARLYCLDGDTGEHRWEATSTSVASPSARADRIVFSDDNINGLRRGDGTREWRTITSGSVDSGWLRVANTSPTVVADTEQAGDPSGGGSADEYTVFVGTDEGRLYVLDLATGETQWRFNPGEPIRSSPTVADGTVYFGCSDTRLYAVDTASATRDWQFTTGDAITSSPTVADGTVFVGGQDGTVYAVDAGTGEEVWQFPTDGGVHSSPTVAGGTVFVGGTDGYVYAIDAEAGEEVWRYETGDLVRSSPTVVDGVCFVGGWDGAVYALDAGVEGSSAGTRVRQGTLGHHHAFAGDPPQTLSMAAAGAVHTPESAPDETDGGDTADDGGAGFGVVAALGGLGGAGYLLRRTLCTDRRRE